MEMVMGMNLYACEVYELMHSHMYSNYHRWQGFGGRWDGVLWCLLRAVGASNV